MVTRKSNASCITPPPPLVVPANDPVKDTDLILRSLRSKRLEEWTQRADSRPSFETRAPDSASALPGERAPSDEVGDIFTISFAGTTGVIHPALSPPLPPPRRRGRQPEAAAKAAVEIGQVVKAAIERDVADPAFAAARQQRRGLAQPQLVQPHRETGAGLKQQFIDIALRQSGRRGQFLRGKIRLGKTLLQDHQHRLQPNRA